MSRKRPKIEPWLCNKNDNPGQGYIRLTRGLLKSKVFTELKPMTQVIYLHMCLAASGKIDFEFPYTAYKGICSKGGFNKAEKELIAKGFIEKTESGRFTRTPNKYRFLFDWKTVN